MRITQVDAFASRPFSGNPAAIVVLDEPADDRLMQLVATEMNLSETCYLYPLQQNGLFNLRWFTPASEVDLCGHGTLAAAHVLWEEGRLSLDQPAAFETRSGLLQARRTDDQWIELDFPSEPVQAVESPADLEAALVGLTPRFVGRNRMDLLVEIEKAGDLRRLVPDMTRVAAINARGVIVTAREDGQPYDFVSRFFAPRLGVPEDPVCGSAHCALTPYWSGRLEKTELLAYQASERGGILRLRQAGDRVVLGGRAVTVLHATMRPEVVLNH